MSDCLSENELAALSCNSGSPQQIARWHHHIRICDQCAMGFVKVRMRADTRGDSESPDTEPGPTSPMHTGLEPNMRIGDFVIEKRLGAGGMGVVYQAFQQSLNRPVALKVLPASVGFDKNAVTRFHREARAAARLHHTNIIAIYAEGQENGTCYYAMEMLQGRSLDRVINELSNLRNTGVDHSAFTKKALTILATGPEWAPGVHSDSRADKSSAGGSYYDCVARLIFEAAQALAYAHGHNVIHRDVKPANLMLTHEGHLVLMDFGLARLLDEQRMTLTGAFMGTPHYMSPELITGRPEHIDGRIDVYSLGATLYELLTLRPPFEGARQEQITHKILHQEPAKPRHLDESIPVDLETICCKALEKSPARRYAGADEMADDLQRYLHRYVIKAKKAGPWTWMVKFACRHKIPCALTGVVLAVALIAGLMSWKYRQLERVQQTMIPEIVNLVEKDAFFDALLVARQVEIITPGDPTLEDLWIRLSRQYTLHTHPGGAKVFISKTRERDDWHFLGRTPLERVRIPFGIQRMRIDRPGYRTLEFAFSNPFRRTYKELPVKEPPAVHYELQPEESLPPEMVWIPPSDMNIFPLYRSRLTVSDVPAYLIDKYETTNEQYFDFVNAGGYRDPNYWEYPFVRQGETLTWQQAMDSFTDQSGQPGPATWINGTYAPGRGDYPVGGISWYEAAAYARFRDKHLPTVFHWACAAFPNRDDTDIAYLSNFSDQLAPVGHYPGLGPFGLYDAAGNVREWCCNAIENEENHYCIQGGAWGDNTYMFTCNLLREAWSREPANGVRCMRFLERDGVPEVVFAPVENRTRDMSGFKPVSDEVFQSYVDTLYHYDHTELDAVVESSDELTSFCRTERISFNASYLGERVTAYLNIPKGVPPPYQIVLWFPSGASLSAPWRYERLYKEEIVYILRSGRALVVPIMKGTYDRRLDVRMSELAQIQLRNLYVQMSQDLRRTIDYLDTRQDMDVQKLAYTGLSLGGKVGPIMVALEPRFRTGLWLIGGIGSLERHPSLDPANFAPRVSIPILMANGREDAVFPYETSQKPLFDLVGTPAPHKKHLLFPGGHSISRNSRKPYLQAICGWLDCYLGPVQMDGVKERD